MGRRWSQQTRAFAYRLLALRDGELCALCGQDPPLDIDHLDGDPTNNDDTNLRLLCRPCNVKRQRAKESTEEAAETARNPAVRPYFVWSRESKPTTPQVHSDRLRERDHRCSKPRPLLQPDRQGRRGLPKRVR